MAETYSSFGIGPAIENQGRAVGVGDYEHLLNRLPADVLKMFSKLAEEGIFGDEGIKALKRSLRKEGGLRRNMLSRALKQRAGRKLGPRAGAIDTQIANQVYAPSFADEEAGIRNLHLANQQSKVGGLEGILSTLGFFQNQVGLNEQLDQSRQGPGFLDYVNPAIDVASLFFAPSTGGASVAANQARKRYD